MKTRPILATALALGMALGVSGADAGTKTLDGKTVKSISFTAVGAPQVNDVTATTNDLDGVERVTCVMPMCASLDFIYKPAKGVKATGLAFESTWDAPVGVDIDLYVAALDKRGDPSPLGQCGASVGSRERIYLAASNFKAGKKYRMIAYFYRTANTSVTTRVTFNGANAIPTTAPAEVDSNVYINCGL